MYPWFFLIPAIVNLASFVASLSLVAWLCRLQRINAKKLLARQLWHLALSDVITSALGILAFIFMVWGNLGEGTRDRVIDAGCRFIHFINIFTLTSLLFELHIAAATVFTIRRCYRALRVLSNAFGFIWLLAFVAVGAMFFSSHPNLWDAQSDFCEDAPYQHTIDCILATTVGLCVAIYIGGALWAWRHQATGSTRRHLLRMVGAFIVAALVTWVPVLLFLLRDIDTLYNAANPIAFTVSVSFLLSNGLVNAAAYALQSRFFRQMQRRTRVLAGSYRHRRHATNATTEWRVAFSDEEDVFAVPAVTHEARSRAERETATLEAGQAIQAAQTYFSDAIQAKRVRHALAGDDVEPGRALAEDDFEPEVNFLACFDLDAESVPEFEFR